MVHLFQDPLGLVHDLLSQWREHHLISAPLKDCHAQFLLQLFDGQTQRRLRHETAFGCPAEMPFLSKGDDVLQFSEGHGPEDLRDKRF